MYFSSGDHAYQVMQQHPGQKKPKLKSLTKVMTNDKNRMTQKAHWDMTI